MPFPWGQQWFLVESLGSPLGLAACNSAAGQSLCLLLCGRERLAGASWSGEDVLGVRPEVLKLLSWGALLTGGGVGVHSCLHVLQTQRWALPDQQQTSLPPLQSGFPRLLEAGCLSKHDPSAESSPRQGKASIWTQASQHPHSQGSSIRDRFLPSRRETQCKFNPRLLGLEAQKGIHSPCLPALSSDRAAASHRRLFKF